MQTILRALGRKSNTQTVSTKLETRRQFRQEMDVDEAMGIVPRLIYDLLEVAFSLIRSEKAKVLLAPAHFPTLKITRFRLLGVRFEDLQKRKVGGAVDRIP
jgi:hypothetical protein